MALALYCVGKNRTLERYKAKREAAEYTERHPKTHHRNVLFGETDLSKCR